MSNSWGAEDGRPEQSQCADPLGAQHQAAVRAGQETVAALGLGPTEPIHDAVSVIHLQVEPRFYQLIAQKPRPAQARRAPHTQTHTSASRPGLRSLFRPVLLDP